MALSSDCSSSSSGFSLSSRGFEWPKSVLIIRQLLLLQCEKKFVLGAAARYYPEMRKVPFKSEEKHSHQRP